MVMTTTRAMVSMMIMLMVIVVMMERALLLMAPTPVMVRITMTMLLRQWQVLSLRFPFEKLLVMIMCYGYLHNCHIVVVASVVVMNGFFDFAR